MKKLNNGRISSLSQKLGSKPIKFILVGLWNTALGYLAFIVLERLFHRNGSPHYIWALVLSQTVIIANAYLCYKFLVFKTSGMSLGEPSRFLVMYGLNFAANLFLLPIFVNVVKMSPVAGQGVTVLILGTANYIGHNFFTFRQHFRGDSSKVALNHLDIKEL